LKLNSNYRKKIAVYILISLLFAIPSVTLYRKITVLALQYPVLSLPANSYDENELKRSVANIYNKRSSAFVTGDLVSLKDIFDTSHKYGQWALEHEAKRVKYLHAWSKQRGMKFTNVQSTVRVKKIYPGDKVVKMALEESYKFDYIYPQDQPPVTNSFGVGIRHTLSLTKKNDIWVVYNDWYTDCFEDALQAYSGEIQGNLIPPESQGTYNLDSKHNPTTIINIQNYNKPYYNREKAIEYADKFCGAAWGSGNNFNYNKKYKDFNGIGGDCTNFASQVLGDKESGALPMDYTWRCEYSKYGNSQGTMAWVNADGLKNYLIYNGKGSIIKRGTFKELTTPQPDYPGGIVQKLQLADLVCYEKKGNIDHFAVITSRDSHGYPLVNSHTTDRYHVPWDLGWGDNKIRFFLIHINS
jgi:hypothetical protein